MAKVRPTLTIDEDVLKWVKVRAARTGVSDSAVIEESLRRDSDDDYLLALAIDRRAYLVTGDKDLLALSSNLPILTPAQFATKLRESR